MALSSGCVSKADLCFTPFPGCAGPGEVQKSFSSPESPAWAVVPVWVCELQVPVLLKYGLDGENNTPKPKRCLHSTVLL